MRLIPPFPISRDMAAGLLYIAIGVGAAIGATYYRMGTATRPGPGFFPLALGVLLVALGLIIFSADLRKRPELRARFGRAEWRGPLFVVLAVIAFAALIAKLGVVIAAAAMTLIAALASHESTWRSSIVCAVIFSVTSVVLFVWALGVHLPIAPFFLGH